MIPAAVGRGAMVRRRTFKADIGVVPPWWREIAEQRKTILTWPEWSNPPELPTGKTIDRFDLRTIAAETIEMIVPLADADGVGLEGVRLQLTAWPYRKDHDVTALLEVPGGRSFVSIARLDAWPPDRHMNILARRFPGLSHLPAIIDGHHVHRFDDNAKLGMRAFGAGNLPLAAPITARLQSFRDLLRVLGVEFRIDGLDDIKPPDWSVLI
jgi:hypothetical protein